MKDTIFDSLNNRIPICTHLKPNDMVRCVGWTFDYMDPRDYKVYSIYEDYDGKLVALID